MSSIGKYQKTAMTASTEYLHLAENDERVSILLLQVEEYRHAMYFMIQAMEKYVRHTVFTLVNPELSYYREKTRTHNVDDLIDFLVSIICTDKNLQDQVKQQIYDNILGGTRFGKLHNDLRYPFFSDKNNCYYSLSITKNDALTTQTRLHHLKLFLKDSHRLF